MPQFEPVVGTTWRRASGDHWNSKYIIESANAVTVRVKEGKSNHGQAGRPGARHKWPREQFLAMFTPDTVKDERACMPTVNVHGVKVQMMEPPKTVEAAIEVMDIEEMVGVRLTPQVMDTALSGEAISVAIASKRCSGCGLKKPLAAFNKNRANADGLADHCRECRARQYQESKLREQQRLQKEQTPAVTLTTTSNAVIEARHSSPAQTPVQTPVQDKRTARVFRVEAMVYERRVFEVEALDIPDAYRLAGSYAEQVEIVSVSQA